MINGDIKLFMDDLYTGQELLFSYRGVKYFVQGWTSENGTRHMECWEYESPGEDYLWKREGASMTALANEFLDAPLWGGKAFEDVQSEMAWLDE